MEYIGYIVVLVIVAAAALFFWRQSKAKTRWGFGSLQAKCPRCGTEMAMIRKPKSLQEMMWGGWTCPNCSAKIDKYGRERP